MRVARFACGLLLGSAVLAAGAAEPCTPRALDVGAADAGWRHKPLSKLKNDTVYTVVQENGHAVLQARADASASAYVAIFNAPMDGHARLAWRWKTDALVEGADNRDKRREDAPLRVMLAFDGDRGTLPDAERKRFERAKRLFGTEPPYALLMYIWSDHVPVGTVIPSAHTSQVKMLVVASGAQGLGQWQSVERRVADDYQQAFGAAPGPLIGVAVMTDTDNTRGKASGSYADIRITCPAG